MATTTNYAWETPDDTDLVKDGAAAIRTLGSSIDTTTKALNPSTTLGDIEYRSSTANTNTRLGIGTTGQVLTVSGGVPSWATPAGGGKVLQVVQATSTTSTNITSSTYTDSGLSATITPTLSTSKILVLVTQQTSLYRSATQANVYGSVQLLRGSTAIWTNDIEALAMDNPNSGQTAAAFYHIYSAHYLDSPATTSATTYKTQGNRQTGGYINFQTNSSMSTMILMEIGA